jgi:nicotinic acid mononucleotide adenylyltransferase
LFAAQWRQKPVLILGGDSLLDLHSWHESEAILQESQIVVYARPGAEAAAQAAAQRGLPYHEAVLSSLSSSTLRALARRGLTLQWQVPEAVRDIIEAEKIYAGVSDSPAVPVQRHRHP